MAARKPDAATARGSVLLMVRTAPAHGDAKRYRAGLGPFWSEPVLVDVTKERAEALKADPMLIVTEAE